MKLNISFFTHTHNGHVIRLMSDNLSYVFQLGLGWLNGWLVKKDLTARRKSKAKKNDFCTPHVTPSTLSFVFNMGLSKGNRKKQTEASQC